MKKAPKNVRILSRAQDISTQISSAIDAYDDDGVDRFVCFGWPCKGKFVGSVNPKEGN